jgi:WD repeat-containing protein 35
MRTAIRCSEFEDVLEPYDIFSLIALAAYHCGYFGVCSKAFVKLETLHTSTNSSSTDVMSSANSSSNGDTSTQQQQQQQKADVIQTLAVNIFTKHPPLDNDPLEQQLRDCLNEGKPFQACTVTGQLITSKTRAIMCKTCRHFAIERELQDITHCPLCHFSTLYTMQSCTKYAEAVLLYITRIMSAMVLRLLDTLHT